MITYGRDLRVFFYDVSAQLLVGGEHEPLLDHFPEPLLGLEIELRTVWSELVTRGKRSGVEPESVQAVYLAPDALEVATVLDTGDVIVHRIRIVPRVGNSLLDSDGLNLCQAVGAISNLVAGCSPARHAVRCGQYPLRCDQASAADRRETASPVLLHEDDLPGPGAFGCFLSADDATARIRLCRSGHGHRRAKREGGK